MADTIVFIPALNEEASLPAVLAELRAVLPDCDVLVVDDGSTDATAAVAGARGAAVVSFGENRGLREGVAAGYRYAHEQGYAFAGRVDADGQHPVEELRRLLELVRAGECDVAIGCGSRSPKGTRQRGTSPRRAVVSEPRCSGARCGRCSGSRSTMRRAACTP